MNVTTLGRAACFALGLSVALPVGVGAAESASAARAGPNRLIDSGSPYLLQHANNPVDWYPWGPEALEKARRENKPIFVSVGYSTCYWCHVANRTLYSNPEIAALMNRWLVSVKVDREQRPDLDAVYMLATTLMTGRGGWPNNVFLTPELKPFFAGSYFPPEDDDFGRPGFVRILRTIQADWTDRRAAIEQIAENATKAMREAQRLVSAEARPVDTAAWLATARANLRGEFDARHGGFQQVQRDGAKFPHEPLLAMLIADVRVTRDRDALSMLVATLDAMALGGIHDHLGGGFHRYAVESSWSVPHFEKMLYNNAQLMRTYAEAWQLTRKPLYRNVAQRTGEYLLRRLAAPEGGFYTAEDAEVGGEEGATYLWTAEEIERALGVDAARAFFAIYQLTRLAAQRETDALEGVTRGALRVRVPAPRGAIATSLAKEKTRLLAVREARAQPARDEKLIVALNGLAIDALAVSGKILDEPKYLKSAERAAQRIWMLAYDSKARRLRHEAYRGTARGEGFLEDYALFGNGLASLADATENDLWRERAARLADDALRLFSRSDGSLAMTLAEKELLVTPDEGGDSAYPSGTSAMVGLLLRLALERDGARVHRAAERVLAAHSGRVSRHPDRWAVLVAAAGKMRPGALARNASKMPAQLALLDTASHVQAAAALRRLPTRDEVVVPMQIEQGFHVNANHASYDYLIATALRLEALEPSRIRYPAPRLFKPAFERQGLKVYEGEVELAAEFPAGSLAGPRTLRAEVRVQACDEQICLPPATLPVTLIVP
jgi:uncharacterized protein